MNGTLSSPAPAHAPADGAAPPSGVAAYIETMKKDSRFADVDWKQSSSTVAPFPDLMLKEVKELVASARGFVPHARTHARRISRFRNNSFT